MAERSPADSNHQPEGRSASTEQSAAELHGSRKTTVSPRSWRARRGALCFPMHWPLLPPQIAAKSCQDYAHFLVELPNLQNRPVLPLCFGSDVWELAVNCDSRLESGPASSAAWER